MKIKHFLACALCFFAATAYAESWVKTHGNEMATAYVDVDSIVRKGNLSTARFKREYIDKVDRKEQTADGKFFSFARTMSVQTVDCTADRRSIDQLWHESGDGKTRSAEKSYTMNNYNSAWETAAKKSVCR